MPLNENYTARITLYGERKAESITYDNAIEAGNKLIANVNKMALYGAKRKQTVMRLKEPALAKSNKIRLDTGLDLVRGDRLALLPTSYFY